MDKKQRIRTLNDLLRKHHIGGEVYITRGLLARAGDRMLELLQAVADYEDWSGDNDPWGEHDCVIMEWEGISIIAKIDYYSKDKQHGSEDPSNENLTCRVMTVMLSSDY